MNKDEKQEKTKEIEKIEDIVDDKENEEPVIISTEEEKESEEIEKIKNEEDKEKIEEMVKKNKKKKTIIIILSILIVLVLISSLVLVLKNKKDKEKIKDDVYNEEKLNEKEKEKKIKAFGEALEKVVLISYEKNKVILSYEEALKLVDIKDDINCSVHEIYEDGKVYLNECSFNGIKTKYSYGTKQEEKAPVEAVDDNTKINVYVNKETRKASLTKPNSLKNYEVYIVDCGDVYQDANLFGDTLYVLYQDNDYRMQMKNYMSGEKILGNIKYDAVLPFMSDGKYDTSYLALLIDNRWVIYNIDNRKPVLTSSLDGVVPSTNASSIIGPIEAIKPLKNNSVIIYKDNKYGVIDYKTGKEIIPAIYSYISKTGEYLYACVEQGADGVIYDLDGNKVIDKEYDNIYGITNGNYVLVNKNNKILLVNMKGKTLFDFGEAVGIKDLNFMTEYNGELLFQFNKTDSEEECMEYSYNLSTKKGSKKDFTCGGIAKPILYLYPTKKTNVTVSFQHPEYLETTYPKFKDKWEVKALSNGDLYDKDGKYYYALYWDEKKVHSVDFSEGFYVEEKDAINFLENKLSYIGLNDKEKNEFIMYWLPILEKNKKSLVYFELTEERESYNKLLIKPKPDSMLRLVIHIKKVDQKTNIKKQSLTKFRRSGFSVVEWGGMVY